eukprot:scaffold18781_cov103-Isochrysis_galbana.AAC.6
MAGRADRPARPDVVQRPDRVALAESHPLRDAAAALVRPAPGAALPLICAVEPPAPPARARPHRALRDVPHRVGRLRAAEAAAARARRPWSRPALQHLDRPAFVRPRRVRLGLCVIAHAGGRGGAGVGAGGHRAALRLSVLPPALGARPARPRLRARLPSRACRGGRKPRRAARLHLHGRRRLRHLRHALPAGDAGARVTRHPLPPRRPPLPPPPLPRRTPHHPTSIRGGGSLLRPPCRLPPRGLCSEAAAGAGPRLYLVPAPLVLAGGAGPVHRSPCHPPLSLAGQGGAA